MKAKRVNQIEEYLSETQEASLEELKEHFNVSLNTIRRDVSELVEIGVLKKVYGGVVYNKKHSDTTAYEERNISYLKQKKNIGKFSGRYIEMNDIVYIDSGTTTQFVLDDLPADISFTLITNSLEVTNKAVTFPHIHLIVVGETYERSTKSFTGISDEESINKYNIDKAFMSATAVSVYNGASNSSLLENRIKRLVCKRANQIYLLADASKFGKNSLFTYCSIENFHAVITDEGLDRVLKEEFEQAKANLVLAERGRMV